MFFRHTSKTQFVHKKYVYSKPATLLLSIIVVILLGGCATVTEKHGEISNEIGQANAPAKSNDDPTSEESVPEETTQATVPPEPKLDHKPIANADAPPATPTTPDTVKPKKPHSPLPSSIMPFQGQRYDGKLFHTLVVDMEKVDDGWKIPFIPKAHAFTVQDIPTFMDDDAPVADDIERINDATPNQYDFNDYWPGYKDQTVYFKLDKQVLSVHPISILRERTIVTSMVSAKVDKKSNAGWKPQAELVGTAIGYPIGGKVLMLYRWKADKKSISRYGILGVDIPLRNFNKKHFGLRHDLPAQVYYLIQGEIYTAEIQMMINLPADINTKWRIF